MRRVADPAHWPVEFEEHLTPAHAAKLFERIDPRKASRYPDDDEDEGRRTDPASRIGRGTTAFAVADAEGNVIAVTQTLSTWGGNFYVSKGQKIGRKGEVRYGYASAVLVDRARGLVEGSAEPRRSHAAVGWSRSGPTQAASRACTAKKCTNRSNFAQAPNPPSRGTGVWIARVRRASPA